MIKQHVQFTLSHREIGTPSSFTGKILRRSLIITAIVMLQPPLPANAAFLDTHGTGADPASVALDTVALVDDVLATDLALLALLAQQARHCGDRLGKDIASALTGDLALLNAVEGALVHDDDARATHDLEVDGADKFACFEHGLARFQHNVFGLHGRHLAVDS